MTSEPHKSPRLIVPSRRYLGLAVGAQALATPVSGRADDEAPQRPAILFNRRQEDWSVLADRRVPRQPGDELKYTPLAPGDSTTYLSFGADQVYALTPYIPAQNKSIDDKQVINAQTLPKVQMPNRDAFIPRFPERMPRN